MLVGQYLNDVLRVNLFLSGTDKWLSLRGTKLCLTIAEPSDSLVYRWRPLPDEPIDNAKSPLSKDCDEFLVSFTSLRLKLLPVTCKKEIKFGEFMLNPSLLPPPTKVNCSYTKMNCWICYLKKSWICKLSLCLRLKPLTLSIRSHNSYRFFDLVRDWLYHHVLTAFTEFLWYGAPVCLNWYRTLRQHELLQYSNLHLWNLNGQSLLRKNWCLGMEIRKDWNGVSFKPTFKFPRQFSAIRWVANAPTSKSWSGLSLGLEVFLFRYLLRLNFLKRPERWGGFVLVVGDEDVQRGEGGVRGMVCWSLIRFPYIWSPSCLRWSSDEGTL